MRDIEARSRTKLKVQREDEMDAATKERYVDIAGTRNEQKAALEALLALATYCREDEGEVLKDSRSNENIEGKNETPHVLEVLPEEVGRVLGRKGETVKILERESATKIEVDKGTGRLEIYGRPEAQEKALELVLAEVSYAKAGDGSILKDQRARPRDQDAVDLPPVKLWVRDRDAGRVIGRGGETVRDVMEKTGADIKVQKSEDMRPGDTEREIKIFGQKEQQDQALQLVLAEVSWARGEEGMLKEPPAAEDLPKPPQREERKRRRPESKEDRQETARERDDGEPRSKRVRRRHHEQKTAPGNGAWVCGICGGDHRTKDCPHANGLLGMGMHIGMQMGMQALGMQSLGMGMMGPPMMPPLMPMPGMAGLPGMMPSDGSDTSYSGSSALSSSSSASDAESVQSDQIPVPTRAPGAQGPSTAASGSSAALPALPDAGVERRPRRTRRRAGERSRSRGRRRGAAHRGGEVWSTLPAQPKSQGSPPPAEEEGSAGEAPEEVPEGRSRRGLRRRRRQPEGAPNGRHQDHIPLP